MSRRETHERRRAKAVDEMRDTIDRFFPQGNQCGLCGDTVLGQRHRVMDAIAGRVIAGDDPVEVADDYGVPLGAVVVALAVRAAEV